MTLFSNLIQRITLAKMELQTRVFTFNEETSTLYKLNHITSVSTKIGTVGQGSASITLSNKGDRYFTSISGKVKSQEYKDYVKEVNNLGLVKKYFKENRQVLIDDYFYGKDPISTSKQQIEDYYEFHPSIKDMNLIWVDYKREGIWRSGFTGIISTVSDSYTAGQELVISLTCKDLTRFFDTTRIVILGGLGVRENFNTLQELYQLDTLEASSVALSDIFAGMPLSEILLRVVELTNLFYQYSPGEGAEEQHEISDYGSRWLWDTDEYKIHYKNQIIDVDRTKGFYGTNNEITDQVFDGDEIKLSVIGGVERRKELYSYLGRRPPFFAINADVIANIEIFEKVIRSAFNFYQHGLDFASQRIQKALNVSFAEMFCDSSGNLIFQLPKFNNLPSYGHIDETDSDLGSILIDKDKKIQFSVKKQYFHGSNYLIGDNDLRSFSYAVDEVDTVTKVAVAGNTHFGMSSSMGELSSLVLSGMSLSDRNLEKKYGVRFQEVASPAQELSVFLDMNQKGGSFFLEAFAEAVKVRFNIDVNKAIFTFLLRSDFQAGRNIYFIERDLLFYISSIKNSLVIGQDAKTTLEVNYGHRPFTVIPEPFTYASAALDRAYEEGTISPGEAVKNNEALDKMDLSFPKSKGFKRKVDNTSDVSTFVIKGPVGIETAITKKQVAGSIEEIAYRAGAKFNVDPRLILAIIQGESSSISSAVSHKGAQGLMQLMPETAKEMGVTDSFNIEQNIMGGTKYFKIQLGKFKNVTHALYAYNAGPAKVDNILRSQPGEWREPKHHAYKVLSNYYKLGGSFLSG